MDAMSGHYFSKQSKFKHKRIIKIWVPTLCILNVGTVPMLYILFVGTVPTLCILDVGTVPTLCILNVGTVPTFSSSHIFLSELDLQNLSHLSKSTYLYLMFA